jgi:hypothetical protein
MATTTVLPASPRPRENTFLLDSARMAGAARLKRWLGRFELHAIFEAFKLVNRSTIHFA